MRFASLHIGPSGAMTPRMLELRPGLQILVATTAQDNAALREWMLDMLFAPLADSSCEGSIRYILDGGQGGDVRRPSGGAEFMGHAALLAAAQHLLQQEVFLNTATILPLPAGELNQDVALAIVRERLIASINALDGKESADRALRILSDRIAEIGRPVSHLKKPLPAARARLEALELELAKARNAAAVATELESRWRAVAEKLHAARRRQSAFEEELRTIERRERAQRLVEAQRLQARLDEVTQTCFVYSSVREFPLDQSPEMQRAANAVATARAQVERTQSELAELDAQLGAESQALDADGVPRIVDVPENTEQALTELESKMVRLRERAEEIGVEIGKARDRVAQAYQDLQGLPDFSRLGADPIAWLSQLATSFRVARQSRNNTVEKLKRMRADIARRQIQRAMPAALFEQFQDFPDEARAYDDAARAYEERAAQLRSQGECLHVQVEERREDLPTMLWAAVLFLGIAAICAGTAIWMAQPFVFLPAALGVAAAAMAFLRWLWTRHTANDAEKCLEKSEGELAQAEVEYTRQRQRIDSVVHDAGYSSLRELEALYERFVSDESALNRLIESEKHLAEEASEDCEHVELLLKRFAETFQTVGETLEHEDDVETAAARAMARYQEYRDAKRRLAESRNRPTQLQQQLEETSGALEACQREEITRALEIRQLLRDAGFREEARYTSVLAALQAYHVRTAQVRERLTRAIALRERCATLRDRLQAEQIDLIKQEESLARRLEVVGANSLDKWQDLARQSKQYRDAWEERLRLQERIEATLRGETIESLRKSVEQEGPGVGPLTRKADDVRLDLRQCTVEIDTLANEERDIQVALADRNSGLRTLNEIEEDLDAAARKAVALEIELEAAAYAASLLEESVRERHARIAPRVAAAASGYLRQLGAQHVEIKVSRDLKITVSTPKKARTSAEHQMQWGRGELDRISLAVQLALFEVLTANGERIPLFVEEPFANCSNADLTSALSVLAESTCTPQLLVFTCRRELAAAATALNLPVLSI